MHTILITGASRGLGLEFCRQYLLAGWQVIATCRSPVEANALQALAQNHDTLKIYPLDVTDFSGIEALSQELRDIRVDVLLNNAGIYSDTSSNGFGRLDYTAWQQTFYVNTMAAVKMIEAFLPQLQRGEKKLAVSISSLMGSMADNTSGGSLLYRSSKAALNAAMKTLSIDLRPQAIGVLILHPGWVRTDMGGKNALIDVEESVSGMRRCIEAFSLSKTGTFVKFDGTEMPW